MDSDVFVLLANLFLYHYEQVRVRHIDWRGLSMSGVTHSTRTADLTGSGWNIMDADFSMFGMCHTPYQDGRSLRFWLEYFGRRFLHVWGVLHSIMTGDLTDSSWNI